MKRYGRGGTEVSVKITCKKKKKGWFEVAITEGILISEIKRRRGKERRKGRGVGEGGVGEKGEGGVVEVGLTFA